MNDSKVKNMDDVLYDQDAGPLYSSGKSKRQDKKHRRYRKIGMHRLKSTHLLTKELIYAVS